METGSGVQKHEQGVKKGRRYWVALKGQGDQVFGSIEIMDSAFSVCILQLGCNVNQSKVCFLAGRRRLRAIWALGFVLAHVIWDHIGLPCQSVSSFENRCFSQLNSRIPTKIGVVMRRVCLKHQILWYQSKIYFFKINIYIISQYITLYHSVPEITSFKNASPVVADLDLEFHCWMHWFWRWDLLRYMHFTSPIRRYADVLVHRRWAYYLCHWGVGHWQVYMGILYTRNTRSSTYITVYIYNTQCNQVSYYILLLWYHSYIRLYIITILHCITLYWIVPHYIRLYCIVLYLILLRT